MEHIEYLREIPEVEEIKDFASPDLYIYKVYLLTNTINGKIYVGQTCMELEDRMGRAGYGYSNSTYLFSAIKKYGYKNFKYELLAKCLDQSTVDYLEDYYIEQYNSRKNSIGYNLKSGGSAGKHSKETKIKIANTMKNKIWSQAAIEARAAAGRRRKGIKKGPKSEKIKEQVAQSMVNWHANNKHPMLGKVHSDETKAKMSIANSGRKHDPGSVKARSKKLEMSEERQKQICDMYESGDTVDSICKAIGTNTSGVYRVLFRHNVPKKGVNKHFTGKTHTEETKLKMAESKKLYWEKWWDEKENSESNENI